MQLDLKHEKYKKINQSSIVIYMQQCEVSKILKLDFGISTLKSDIRWTNLATDSIIYFDDVLATCLKN